ncbi:MAG TPA: S41 family peptidase [Pyrinomonadaceae bacterium]|nr:S41 family peptidase [Pyrinomonadaceae bacterium]
MHRPPTKTQTPSKARLALVALLLLALLAALTTRGAANDNAPGAEGRLAVFDEVWRTVGERYYDPSMNGVDWPRARAEFRPHAAAALHPSELYGTLRRMLALLRDPHTRVHAPGERADWREARYVSVGVGVREVEGALVAAWVERGSEAWRAGVRAGDELLTVEGEPASILVARVLAERAGASKPSTARALAVARLFEGPPDTFVNVGFGGKSGAKERIVRLRRVVRTRAPEWSVRREGGAALVRFNLFTPETAAEFARALGGELRGARGLVLDLRENGGGEAEAMADIASALLPAGARLGRFTDRRGRPQMEPRTRTRLLSTAESLVEFRGPVVVLTGTRTASAAEVLAAALKEHGRARVVGEETCGCVLGIRRRHTLPDGGTLEVSEMDFRTASGARLEGAGVTPDETVKPTRRDLADRRDPALSRALELLKRQ